MTFLMAVVNIWGTSWAGGFIGSSASKIFLIMVVAIKVFYLKNAYFIYDSIGFSNARIFMIERNS